MRGFEPSGNVPQACVAFSTQLNSMETRKHLIAFCLVLGLLQVCCLTDEYYEDEESEELYVEIDWIFGPSAEDTGDQNEGSSSESMEDQKHSFKVPDNSSSEITILEEDSLETAILCDTDFATIHCDENALCLLNSDKSDNDSYSCICKMGFVDILPFVPGKVCKSETTGETGMTLGVCLNYCMNSGTCFVINYEPRCSCMNDYAGARCEIPNLISFLSMAVPIIFAICILLVVMYYNIKRYIERKSVFGSNKSKEEDDDDPETNTIIYKRTDFMNTLYNP